MSGKTGIEWTDATWNPIRGCSRVSEGCRFCYAERIAARFSGPGQAYEGLARMTKSSEPRWTGNVRLLPEKLDEPLSWRKPRMVFVNSMSDLFHPDVPAWFVAQIWARMGLRNIHSNARHVFQILTKRPDRMARIVSELDREAVISVAIEAALMKWGPLLPSRWEEWKELNGPAIRADFADSPLPNVWLGVSIEDQAAADERIPSLLQTPAAVRFLSCEPLLGQVDLRRWMTHAPEASEGRCVVCGDVEHGPAHAGSFSPLDWVIAGGESGPNARPPHPDWFRSLRDQCEAAAVPYFFKQWGGPTPKSGGRLLDGEEWNQMPLREVAS